MTIEYAYKSLTEDTWHKEIVDKLVEGKGYKIGGVDYGGFLRMAVDDEAVYIAYAGLGVRYYDEVLDGVAVKEKSIKLAKRPFDEEKWYVREVTYTGDLNLFRTAFIQALG